MEAKKGLTLEEQTMESIIFLRIRSYSFIIRRVF